MELFWYKRTCAFCKPLLKMGLMLYVEYVTFALMLLNIGGVLVCLARCRTGPVQTFDTIWKPFYAVTCVTWQIKFKPFTLACVFYSTRAGDVSRVVRFNCRENLTLGCGAFCNFRSERLSNALLCPGREGAGVYIDWCINFSSTRQFKIIVN